MTTDFQFEEKPEYNAITRAVNVTLITSCLVYGIHSDHPLFSRRSGKDYGLVFYVSKSRQSVGHYSLTSMYMTVTRF